jgi:competence protein ComEA
VEPGVYELPAGARVADAIERAGGPLARADLDSLNLAAVVVDGTQILVLGRGSRGATPMASAGPSQPGLVNLNTGDQLALESVPGIGPVTAGAILALRAEIGSFTSIDQLLDVSGIGPATLESIRPYVTL